MCVMVDDYKQSDTLAQGQGWEKEQKDTQKAGKENIAWSLSYPLGDGISYQ